MGRQVRSLHDHHFQLGYLMSRVRESTHVEGNFWFCDHLHESQKLMRCCSFVFIVMLTPFLAICMGASLSSRGRIGRAMKKMGRPPCCDKTNVKRGLWTAEEDAKILAYVSNHGIGNWTLVPKKAGLNRCGKSCRLRWTNYLRPDLKHDSFTPQEEQLIIQLHKAIGSRWSLIAKQLHGRTDNDVKNYWNTKLKKKLTKMGIDPVTHKPFSQILCDYENISNLPNTHKIRMPTTDMQFQAANQQHFMDEVISPSSSSSSTSSILWQQPSPASITASYGCSEVLAGDPHPQIQMLGVEDHLSGTSGYKFTESGITGCSCEPSSSSANSFIESIVDRDIQMRLEFPALDEILDY